MPHIAEIPLAMEIDICIGLEKVFDNQFIASRSSNLQNASQTFPCVIGINTHPQQKLHQFLVPSQNRYLQGCTETHLYNTTS